MAVEFEHDPRNVVKVIFDSAKRYWVFSQFAKFGLIVTGIALIELNVTAAKVPVILAIVALISELTLWQSERIKGTAESLKRRIEYLDAFGWPIPRIDYSDFVANLTGMQRNAVKKTAKENYFASKEALGPKRAMENLLESSWWSKHLAGNMCVVCAVIISLLLISSICILSLTIATITNLAALQSVSKVVIAMISLISSLGLVRLLYGYFKFVRRSDKIEQTTAQMLSQGQVSFEEAIVQLHEYQISRAAAPLIPDLLWKLRRNTLNDLWAAYRQPHSD